MPILALAESSMDRRWLLGIPEKPVPVQGILAGSGPPLDCRRLDDRFDQGNPGNARFLRRAQHRLGNRTDLGMDQVNEAYERVIKSDVRYRFVIDMA